MRLTEIPTALLPVCGSSASHLSYCSNIHPAETWEDTRTALEAFVPAVKAQASPHAAFGVGLRLSALAAKQLEHQAGQLLEFQQFLTRNQLYVFTINGFPYGNFHGPAIKAQVYQPDWRSRLRLDYSQRLARLLCHLLPPDGDQHGSISTLPGAYKAHLGNLHHDSQAIADQLLQQAAYQHRLHLETGRLLTLALEPEPACLLETSDDAVAFFQQYLLSPTALSRMATLCHCPTNQAETLIRRHLGICLDCCHAAVEFEDATLAINTLQAAGLAIAKIQLSSGLRIPQLQAGHRQALQAFAEHSYLHQVVQRTGTQLRHFDDLPTALAQLEQALGSEWRIHFHIPLWAEQLGELASTQAFVQDILRHHRRQPLSPHLEVETYSWNVLPAHYRRDDIASAISRELLWVKEQLLCTNP